MEQGYLHNPFFVDMAELRLIGFEFLPSEIRAGDVLPVGIYWRAREQPRGDYWVEVQLRDVSGRVVAQSRNRPATGAHPTAEWHAGEVLLDWHDLTIPASLARAQYSPFVVLSDAGNGAILGETSLGTLLVVQP